MPSRSLSSIVSESQFVRRYPSAPVCEPNEFIDQIVERDEAIESAKKSLFATGNKSLRTLNVVFASAGMGKSAFLDALSLSFSADYERDDKAGSTARLVVPINLSFNTKYFGSH